MRHILPAMWMGIGLVSGGALASGSAPAAAQFAIVVHPDLALEDVRMEKLARLYWAQTTTLVGDQPVVLAELQPLRQEFYDKLLQKTAKEVAKRWLKVIFAGEAQKPPVQLKDASEVKRLVAQTPSAIAFIAHADVDASVKVLKVNGFGLQDPGYPLR